MRCPALVVAAGLFFTLWLLGHMVPCSERIDGAGKCKVDPAAAAIDAPTDEGASAGEASASEN